MSYDANDVVRSDQSRISNDDRSQMTGQQGIKFDDADDSNIKKYERMNRQNLIFVLSFIGAIFIIVLLIILL